MTQTRAYVTSERLWLQRDQRYVQPGGVCELTEEEAARLKAVNPDMLTPRGPAPPEPDYTAELMRVDGIGKKTARSLVEAGITDLRTLAEVGPDTLVDALDVKVEQVQEWQVKALGVLNG